MHGAADAVIDELSEVLGAPSLWSDVPSAVATSCAIGID